MPIRRMNVDVPSEVYDKYKEACAKNHVLIKDEIFKFICASLDGASVEPLSGKSEEAAEAKAEEFDGVLNSFAEGQKEQLDAELAPIREKLDGLESTDVSAIRHDVDGLKRLLESPQQCPKKEELDQKFKVLANFIENHLYMFMKVNGANVCAEDITGLAVLRNEEVPSTKGLDKSQLKELFIKGMKTKAF